MSELGDTTIDLLEQLAARSVRPAGVIMRHSARTFLPDVHDLDNNLTDAGREMSLAFGRKLPKSYRLRAYASPPRRCIETGELILRGHQQAGGAVMRTRPIEVLGVFYVLDQMKMYRILKAAGDLRAFTAQWVRGELAPDVVMDASEAARIIMGALAAKLGERTDEARLDLFVSHDMTLHLLKACLLGEQPIDASPVAFLEGIAFHFDSGALVMQGVSGNPVTRRAHD